MLGEAKVRPHKVRGWLNRADDDMFWVRAGAVCRLYLDPPPGAVLVSVDEKTGMQAKSRRYPEIPVRPGRDARREFEYVRHGTVSIITAMNVDHRRGHHRARQEATIPPRSSRSWAWCTR